MTMESMERFHRINGYTCFSPGVTLNSALIWLVWERSPVELRVCSRLLLQTAVIDMAYLITAFVYMPVSLFIQL